LQLAYSRRINRPTYNEMAPYVFFFGLHTFVAGNLSLKPAISDGLDLTYKWHRLWITLGYNNTKDDIVSYQPTVNESANAIIYRSENLDYKRSYSLSTSFPLKITSWWNMQNDFSFFHNKIRTNHLKENITDQNISASLNSTMQYNITTKLFS
jgi:outer membrane receptor protein involved in Fe transport